MTEASVAYKNVPGNYYDKYHTRNPIARYLMDGFLGSFHELTDVAHMRLAVRRQSFAAASRSWL